MAVAADTKERYDLVDKALWSKVGETPRDVLADVLRVPVYKYINSADNVEYSVEFAAKLSKDELGPILDLLRGNMKNHYEKSGWGWNEKKKLRELKDDEARFLIMRDTRDGSLVGFVHFRFLVEGFCTVLYCYELQVHPERTRRGLGRKLMGILEMIGRSMRMEFLMLTVLLNNTEAHSFYTKIRYIIDETSPQMDLDTDGRDVPYEILSKRLLAQAAPNPQN